MDVISLGPVLVSGERLAAVGAIWLFVMAAGLLDRWSPRPLSTVAWRALLGGLIAARIGYVATHSAAFGVEPASALYVWQGGFSLGWGLAGAGAYVAAALRSPRAIAMVGLAASVGVGAWLAAGALLAPQQPATPLPRIAAMRLDGTPVATASLAGRPLVINLWATWCGPCRREMPMLMEVAATRSDVTFLLLNQGEAKGVVRRYLEDNGLSAANVALDPGSDAGRRLGAPGLPMTLFISADGLVRSSRTGEISRAALADELNALATQR